MKFKLKATPKDWLIFAIFAVVLLFAVSILVVNINLKRNIVYVGFIKKKMLVIDDTYSSIIPAIYKCVDCDGNLYTIEMYNHYGINQARNGDYLYIQANEYYI